MTKKYASNEVFQEWLFTVPDAEKAVFSTDRAYRYTLWRRMGERPGYVQYIGLNPSTADETRDDHTIRKLRTFTKNLGYDTFCMTNLFAFRATDPKVMKKQFDPVGRFNNEWLCKVALDAALIVACWGVHGNHRGQDAVVKNLLPELHCFGKSKDGFPLHPLMLPYDTKLEKF